MLAAYYRRLTHPDDNIRLEAAKAWSLWEASTSKLRPDPALMEKFGQDYFAVAFARIECHYFMNGGFFDTPNQILTYAHRLRSIPGVIVQGRYDVVCPPKTAWELHGVWPEAEFILLPEAGHSALEVSITDALVQATDRFARH